MRKLREAAVVAAVVGSVSMIGAGAAAACGDDKPAPPPAGVSIECTQNVGDTTTNEQEVSGGLLGLNISDALNGGDADSSSNQQVCGLENKNIESNAGDAEGGTGADVL
jgi:hypothetical protein